MAFDDSRPWGTLALVAFLALSLGYRWWTRAEASVPAPEAATQVPDVMPVEPREPDFRALLDGRRVDVNRASDAVLQQLPGIGPRLSERIRKARAGAPFRSAGDLQRVRGLGPKSVAKLEPFLRFGTGMQDAGLD